MGSSGASDECLFQVLPINPTFATDCFVSLSSLINCSWPPILLSNKNMNVGVTHQALPIRVYYGYSYLGNHVYYPLLLINCLHPRSFLYSNFFSIGRSGYTLAFLLFLWVF